jgi:hypothetical protein
MRRDTKPVQPLPGLLSRGFSDFGRLSFRADIGSREDGHPLPEAILSLEFHDSVNFCEQRIIFTHSDVGAGMYRGSSLSDKDAAGQNELSGESLDAQSLARAVPTVS